jgi:hypothetical protein
MWWHSLKYTDELPENTGGDAKAWFVRVRPKYKLGGPTPDPGIHAHEIQGHVKRFWILTVVALIVTAGLATLGFFLTGFVGCYVIMILSPATYTAWYATKRGCLGEELFAYKIQLSLPPATNDPGRTPDEYKQLYAQFISESYGLSITTQEVYKLL